MSRHNPTNTDDIIDSRDIIRRIGELDDERSALADKKDDAEADYRAACDDPDRSGEWAPLKETLENAEQALTEYDDTDEGQELKALQSLADQAEGYADDWTHGATLIRDSYFERYAQELADDLGAIPKDAGWPCTCIDWNLAADELKQDYTSVDFDDVTYWIR